MAAKTPVGEEVTGAVPFAVFVSGNVAIVIATDAG
jgi:hypothetical protein